MTDAIVAAGYRKVLALFLSDLLDGVGWWYRLPQMSRETSNETEKHYNYPPDNLMPHLGRVFGLHEDATAVVLGTRAYESLHDRLKSKEDTAYNNNQASRLG
jgi:hypothetical protein